MQRRKLLVRSALFVAGFVAASVTGGCTSAPKIGKKEKLKLAIADTSEAEGLREKYEPFRASLEKILETPIAFFPVEDRFETIAALQLQEVDLVWAGPSEYITIQNRTNTVPIVGISRPVSSVVFAVRANGGIRSLADLKGKNIEMGTPGSTMSHILPLKVLLDAGLDPRTDIHIVHSDAYRLEALQNGTVDAWARANRRYDRAIEEAGLSRADYPTLVAYRPVPHDILLGGVHLNTEWVENMRSRLLKNSNEVTGAIVSVQTLAAQFEGSQLVPISDADYDILRDVYRAIGEEQFL